MPTSVDNYSKYLNILTIFMVLLLLGSVFKNISYPLLWADESMTVMHGERVLEFGYPKVHDGKNVVYDLRHPNPTLGIEEKTDAYIGGANWGQYYFAALGVKLAEMANDIYVKTAIIRIPFAIIGLTGLLILAFLASHFFASNTTRNGFLSLFAFFEVLSVPLVLHLREVRYYSLTLFLISLTIYIYTRYKILRRGGYGMYAVLLTISLFLLYTTFSPVYFISLIVIFLFESMAVTSSFFAKNLKERRQNSFSASDSFSKSFKKYIQDLLPLIISLIAILPLLSFFKTFYIAEEMAKYNNQLFNISGWNMYKENIAIIWHYFTSFDFIYLAIFLKFCLVLAILRFSLQNLPSLDKSKIIFSSFLTLFFIVYFVAIARIPNFAYTRYFISLQPILAVIIILDMALVFNFISGQGLPGRNYYKSILLIVSAGFIMVNISNNIEYIKGHMHEMFHQYKGALDYIIPFINETYADTDKLVIATNYEETSLMYYLKSKVIVGYAENNLQQDMQMEPDVIIYRKAWQNIDPKIFVDFLRKNKYKRISFPVFDYDFNNVPQLNLTPAQQHQFRTLLTDDEEMKVSVFLKIS